MPAHDATGRATTLAQERMLAALSGSEQRPATQADVQELTAVVAELVRMLRPPSALIITGAEAQRAFAELRASGMKEPRT